MVGDLLYGLYQLDELNGFNKWAVEQSLKYIGSESIDCTVVHVDDRTWQLNASKVENVALDDEKKQLFNFFNCDRPDLLEKQALLACEASRLENLGRSNTDNYTHYQPSFLPSS